MTLRNEYRFLEGDSSAKERRSLSYDDHEESSDLDPIAALNQLRDEAYGFATTTSAITPELVEWHGRLVKLTAELFGPRSSEMHEVAGLKFEAFPEFLSAIERQLGEHKDADKLIVEGNRQFFQRRMADAAEVITGLLYALTQRRSVNPNSE